MWRKIVMDFFIWFPAASLVGFVALKCFQGRHALVGLAQSINNGRAFASLSREQIIAALPDVVTSNIGFSDSSYVKGAIGELVEYARGMTPDWIVGVNPGGRMLSAHVAKSIALPPDRCLYVRSDSITHEITCESGTLSQLSGTILVVDDICRTGRTLQSVKELIARSCSRYGVFLKSVAFAVLVVDAGSGYHASFAPDWAKCKTTRDGRFRFPWSVISDQIRREAELHLKVREGSEGARPVSGCGVISAEEDRLASDAEYAETRLVSLIG